MVSLEAVMEVSGSSHEDLSRVERGEAGDCVDAEVLRAYEMAMGVTVETEVFALMDDILRSLVSAHEMLSRLYRARDVGLLHGSREREP